MKWLFQAKDILQFKGKEKKLEQKNIQDNVSVLGRILVLEFIEELIKIEI